MQHTSYGGINFAYGVIKNYDLIFDEVITGFRASRGGAQQYYGVTPDLTTLGKIVGGGLPMGAFCGKKEIMELSFESRIEKLNEFQSN